MKTEQIITHIVHWLKHYDEQANTKGFVVGISGGIDSALVSTLAAMTGKTTLVLSMPIRQKPDQLARANEHIAFLKSKFQNVQEQNIDLTATFNTFEATVKSNTEFPSQKLALANSRSRLRMTTLYYFAQIHGLLVAGTGNKVEDFGVGFFTKYGDGGVDISPIADLTKTEVYTLAKHLELPQSIQEAQPTDGLWDEDRTDEQQMGATYPELEWAMQVYNSHSASDFTGRQRAVFETFDRLHRATLHKIQPIPVCKIPDNLK